MKLLKLTIRTRLSLLFAFSAVLILLVLSVFIYSFTYNFRKQEFRGRMEKRLREADQLLRENKDYPFMTLDRMPPGTLPDEDFFYRKPEPEVKVWFGKDTLRLARLADVVKDTFYYTDRGHRSFLIHYDKTLGNVIVLTAVDRFGFTKLQNLRSVLLNGVLLGALAMGFISWYLPRRELRPLSDKIRKARRIGGESLNLRLNVRNDYDELGELAITFNQMLDRIQKAFEVQKQFTSNAAHELRNPITAISGEAQFALMHPRTADEYQASLQRINDKSEELKKLVDRLLILAKIESAHAEKKAVRVDEALLDALASVQSRHPKEASTISLHMDEAESEAYLLNGDAVMLEVAFFNVLENALKYGEGNQVRIQLSKELGNTVITVTDNGMGVTADEMGRLFQLFYRTNAVRHIQGIGVGLPLVKSIVEWHGGEISLHHNQPSGTRVVITLPDSREKKGSVETVTMS